MAKKKLAEDMAFYQNQTLNRHIKMYPGLAESELGYKPHVMMGEGKAIYRPLEPIIKSPFANVFEVVKTPKWKLTGNLIMCEKVGDEKTKRPFYFEYISDGKKTIGVFVSDQINNRTLKPKDTLMQALYRELDLGPYDTSEEKMLRKVEHIYPKVFPDEQLKKHPTIEEEPRFSFTLSNRGTKKRYNDYYKQNKGKEYMSNTVWVQPDFISRNRKDSDKITVIEVENSFHNTFDFLWKLWRLSGTKLKVQFIFTEKNLQHHLEAIARFKRETGRKVYRFHFTTIEKLKEFEDKDPSEYTEEDVFTRFTKV